MGWLPAVSCCVISNPVCSFNPNVRNLARYFRLRIIQEDHHNLSKVHLTGRGPDFLLPLPEELSHDRWNIPRTLPFPHSKQLWCIPHYLPPDSDSQPTHISPQDWQTGFHFPHFPPHCSRRVFGQRKLREFIDGKQ